MRISGVIIETGDRPAQRKSVSVPPRANGFQGKFRAALTNESTTVVQRGDTLSEIVSTHLRATGQGGDARALYRSVAEVAHANHISDPDLIRPGQTIDLSAVDPPRTSSRTASATTRSRAISANAESLVTSASGESLPWDGLVDGTSRLTSEFGSRIHPIDGRRQNHQGIDVAAQQGTPIQAMDAGTVVYSGWHGGHGKAVVVRHADGVETLYAHASRTLVEVGDRVSAETPLALVGSTGKSTGPHLHFEVRVQGAPVDPLAYLSERGTV